MEGEDFGPGDDGFMHDIGHNGRASRFFDEEYDDLDGRAAQLGGNAGSEGVLEYKDKPRYCRMGKEALTVGASADPNDGEVKTVINLAGCTVEIADDFLQIVTAKQKEYDFLTDSAESAKLWAAAITERSTLPVSSPRRSGRRASIATIPEDGAFMPVPLKLHKSKSYDPQRGDKSGSPSGSPRSGRSRRKSTAVEMEQQEVAAREDIEVELVEEMELVEGLMERIESAQLEKEQIELEIEIEQDRVREEAQEKWMEYYAERQAELEEQIAAIKGQAGNFQEEVSRLQQQISTHQEKIEDNREMAATLTAERNELLEVDSNNDGFDDEDFIAELAASAELAADEARAAAQAAADEEVELEEETFSSFYEEYFMEQITPKQLELEDLQQGVEDAKKRKRVAAGKSKGQRKSKLKPIDKAAYIASHVTEAIEYAKAEAEMEIEDAKLTGEAEIEEAGPAPGQDENTESVEIRALRYRVASSKNLLEAVERQSSEADDGWAAVQAVLEEAEHKKESIQSQLSTKQASFRNAELRADKQLAAGLGNAVADAESKATSRMNAEKTNHVCTSNAKAKARIAGTSRSANSTGLMELKESQLELQRVQVEAEEAEAEAEEAESGRAQAEAKAHELVASLTQTEKTISDTQAASSQHADTESSSKINRLRVSLQQAEDNLATERGSTFEAKRKLTEVTDSRQSASAAGRKFAVELERLEDDERVQKRVVEEEIELDFRSQYTTRRRALETEIDAAATSLRQVKTQAAVATESSRYLDQRQPDEGGGVGRLETRIRESRSHIQDMERALQTATESKYSLAKRLTNTVREVKLTKGKLLQMSQDNAHEKAALAKETRNAEQRAEASKARGMGKASDLLRQANDLVKHVRKETGKRLHLESRCAELASVIAGGGSPSDLATIKAAAASAETDAEGRARARVMKVKEEIGWLAGDFLSESGVDVRVEAVNRESEEKWRQRYAEQTSALKQSLQSARKRHTSAVEREEDAMDMLTRFRATHGRSPRSAAAQLRGDTGGYLHRADASTAQVLYEEQAAAAAAFRERRAQDVLEVTRSNMHRLGLISRHDVNDMDSRPSSSTEREFSTGDASPSRPSTPSEYSPEELYNMGITFRDGVGLPADVHLAFTYFQSAADHGNIDAVVALADCYQRGLGVDQDEQAAISLYEQAAEHGHTIAMLNLSLLNLGMTFNPNHSTGGDGLATFRQQQQPNAWISRRSYATESPDWYEPGNPHLGNGHSVHGQAMAENNSGVDASPPVSSVNGPPEDDNTSLKGGGEKQRSRSDVIVRSEQRALKAEQALAEAELRAEKRALMAEQARADAEKKLLEAEKRTADKLNAMRTESATQYSEHQQSMTRAVERVKAEAEKEWADYYAQQALTLENRLSELEMSAKQESAARDSAQQKAAQAQEALRKMELRLQAAEAVKTAAVEARVEAELYSPRHRSGLVQHRTESEGNGWRSSNRASDSGMLVHREKIKRQAAEQRAADAEHRTDLMESSFGGSIPEVTSPRSYQRDAFTPRSGQTITLGSVPPPSAICANSTIPAFETPAVRRTTSRFQVTIRTPWACSGGLTFTVNCLEVPNNTFRWLATAGEPGG
jgi:TPR repeat protein